MISEKKGDHQGDDQSNLQHFRVIFGLRRNLKKVKKTDCSNMDLNFLTLILEKKLNFIKKKLNGAKFSIIVLKFLDFASVRAQICS